ncbi:hypothetical protein KXD40_001417 [Peronospora effusa]|nr:hypothetical protein KXD40_001417 [Peronospora effusa]
MVAFSPKVIRKQFVMFGKTSGRDGLMTSCRILRRHEGHIVFAWSDGEKTRVRQRIQNIMAVALDRELTEPAGISILEIRMHKPQKQRFDSLIVDQPTAVSVHAQTHTRRRDRESETDISGFKDLFLATEQGSHHPCTPRYN